MKTNLLTISLLLITSAMFSQTIEPTRYYLDSLKNITILQNYKYIRVVENYKNETNLFLFTDYYRSGAINMKAISRKKDKADFHGPKLEYYENGKEKKESNYIKNKLNGTQIELYENGNKKQESNYIDNNLNGKQLEWYENGEKKTEKEITWDIDNKNSITKIMQFWNKEKQQTVIDGNGEYENTDENLYEKGPIKNGEKQGVWEGKNLKENYSFSEIYKNGKFTSGISTDKNNNKFPYKEFMEKAIPKNGITNFYQYIGRNYKSPNIQGLSGKVYATFIVDKDGSLTDFKILRDIGHDTGQEAIRVLSKAEKWIPGKMRGIPTKVLYSLPISIQTAVNTNQNLPSQRGSNMMNNTNSPW
ncbi:MAG: energy transducer TonB [Bacteroidota bacterium]